MSHISPKLAAQLSAHRQAKAAKAQVKAERAARAETARRAIEKARASSRAARQLDPEQVREAKSKASLATAAVRESLRAARRLQDRASRAARDAEAAAAYAKAMGDYAHEAIARTAILMQEAEQAVQHAADLADAQRKLKLGVRRVTIGKEVLEYQIGSGKAAWMAHLRAIRAAYRKLG
jgi:hypothetical protein